MGWTSFSANGRTANEILTAEFTQSANRADGSIQTQWDVIDSSTRGREWYAVIRTTNPGDGYTRYFGMVCLWSMKNGEFAYKDIAEECGPYAANAPIRLINKLNALGLPHNTMAAEWRAQCIKNAQKPRFKPCAGMDISYGAVIYKLIAPAGARRGWIVQHESGKQYRLPARALSQAVPV